VKSPFSKPPLPDVKGLFKAEAKDEPATYRPAKLTKLTRPVFKKNFGLAVKGSIEFFLAWDWRLLMGMNPND
jgi:hypothetical protein